MKLIKSKKAATGKGMRHNIEVMKDAGYSTKRAQGAAYGEVGMEKKKAAAKKAPAKKAVAAKKVVKKSCRK